MALVKEFKEFALKGNVLDLAVGVIIGAAFGKIVDGAVKDIFMPIIGMLMPGDKGWQDFAVGPLKLGHLLSVTIDFLIMAMVLFFIVKMAKSVQKAEATTKACGECLEQIPLAAKRCKACTAPVT